MNQKDEIMKIIIVKMMKVQMQYLKSITQIEIQWFIFSIKQKSIRILNEK